MIFVLDILQNDDIPYVILLKTYNSILIDKFIYILDQKVSLSLQKKHLCCCKDNDTIQFVYQLITVFKLNINNY